ncbi:hypothetical protein ES703_114342 [subsurface metagenome]
MTIGRKILLQTRKAGHSGGMAAYIIGAEWNQGTDTWTRIDVDGNVIGAPDFDTKSPWQDIVRCTLNTDGSENEVSANGKGDDISLDGSTGRVMVRIPKFWVKSDSPGANIYRWWIADGPHAGFVVHPAFKQRGGDVRDYIYVGAYEAGDDGANKLESQTGDTVTVSQTIGTFRTWAENIGSVRWGITSIWVLSAIKLLYYIEYADANSQTTIGKGITSGVKELTGADGIDANLATNGTGTGTGIDDETPVAYRGMENLWGNVRQFIDGYEAVNGSDEAHVKYRLIKRDGSGTFRNPLQAADYEESSDLVNPADGYIKNIVWEDLLSLQFIGSDNTGLATSHLYDYFYVHDAGEVDILLAGGYMTNSVLAGVASLDSANAATDSTTYGGGRLEFI